ncbi:MAG: retroviral-like aspartic protease family protein [Candidatus Omnitrophica bacterium]|nr:retroviral-like aspartic protease family protein [Candidatus Omnitrophota bacterium]
MKIVKTPFTKLSAADIARPWLPVIIINPHTSQEIQVLGLIDTGADECALPAAYASLLGHNLQAGKPKEVSTGNGITIAYSHTSRIRVGNFTTDQTLIDFMPNLSVPLLEMKNFLNHFVLTVDYLNGSFSLEKP